MGKDAYGGPSGSSRVKWKTTKDGRRGGVFQVSELHSFVCVLMIAVTVTVMVGRTG